MSWRVAKSLNTLKAQVDAAWPSRNDDIDGTIGDAAHAARKSDHNPNEDGVVTARDITHDPASGADMGALAERLRLSRDPRIKYVIFNWRMFSSYPTSSYPAWTWRPYSGVNGHKTHVHISVVGSPSLYDDPQLWDIGNATAGEDEMTLRRGSKGQAVTLAQEGLLGWKADSLPEYGADGSYGGETVTAAGLFAIEHNVGDITGQSITAGQLALILSYRPVSAPEPPERPIQVHVTVDGKQVL